MKKSKKQNLDFLDYVEPVSKIYFVRHGQTKANKNKLIFGQWNISLNETGKLQAKQAGKKLSKLVKKENISCIIASPLKRTKETAKIIGQITGIKKIIFYPELIEKSEGLWEKKTYWQVRKDDSKNYYQWAQDPYNRKPPGGESVLDLQKRIKTFYTKLQKDFYGRNVIVVSHSGPIRMFILNMLNSNIKNYWRLKVENGSITEVHISENHAMVWAVNRI